MKFLTLVLVIAVMSSLNLLRAAETIGLTQINAYLQAHPVIGNCQVKTSWAQENGQTLLQVDTFQSNPNQSIRVIFNQAAEVSRGADGYFYYVQRFFYKSSWGGFKKTYYRDVLVLEFSANNELIGFKTRLFQKKIDPVTDEPYWDGIKNLFCLGNPF